MPQEVVNEVFSYLNSSEVAKAKALCRDYNNRFARDYWYSASIIILFRVYRLRSLIQTLESCEIKSPCLRKITFYAEGNQDPPAYSMIKPHLTKLFSMLTTKGITFRLNYRQSNKFGYWKPVVDAVLENRVSTIQTICQASPGYVRRTNPIHGLPLHRFQLSTRLADYYRTTLSNLNRLKITTAGQALEPELTRKFWLFIDNIGANLTELKVSVVHRHRIKLEHPDWEQLTGLRKPAKGYLPPSFRLPKLKKLHLEGASVTVDDIERLLDPHVLESLHISECQMDEPIGDWFKFLKYLQGNQFSRPRMLCLVSRDDFLDRGYQLMQRNQYDLPELWINGDWTTTVCHRSPLERICINYLRDIPWSNLVSSGNR
ncbi:hypothetical protein TWF506_010455 [Arthrobotrys conoides]|uniref:F-box domain-containing protein n=1 Tax=Arthrobotrys conoides TaxID=74498 RepID=A0AAN8NKH1_9PEZI